MGDKVFGCKIHEKKMLYLKKKLNSYVISAPRSLRQAQKKKTLKQTLTMFQLLSHK